MTTDSDTKPTSIQKRGFQNTRRFECLTVRLRIAVEKKAVRTGMFPIIAMMVIVKIARVLEGANILVMERKKMFEILGAVFEFLLILFSGANFSRDEKK